MTLFAENLWLSIFIFPLIGYLSGSLAFSLWITRAVKGVDVRETGSKHATTTNTIRQAGFGPGAVVLILDISKGFLPVFFASRAGLPAWLIGLTAAAAVTGHCWPLFAGFRGGMGLATTGGSVLAVSWLAFLVSLAILIALTLGLKHGARASVISGVALAPVYLLMGLRGPVVWIGALGGLIIAIRFMVDWRREYKELWLDRSQSG